MYMLGVRDYLKVTMRVGGVAQARSRNTGMYCLNAVASLVFSTADQFVTNVALWAPIDCSDVLHVDEEFVDRFASVEAGMVPSDYGENPYARVRVGINAIFFTNPMSNIWKPVLVTRMIQSWNDPLSRYFEDGPRDGDDVIEDMA